MVPRRSGILLHVTSLPSPHGIGDLGPGAHRFVDFLDESGQSLWQVLPLTPTSSVYGNSPYSSCSAFAGNPLLISLEHLLRDGLLSAEDMGEPPPFPNERVAFEAVRNYKMKVLEQAAQRFKRSGKRSHGDFERFCGANAGWLEDHALFTAIKDRFMDAAWYEWPREFRDRENGAMAGLRHELADKMLEEKFFQYLFAVQWQELKDYCNGKNIQIVGDMPIYVSLDSCDTWSNPGIFKLDAEKRPTFVAGVPPDYFSATGQRWGNPVYDWDALRQSRYAWWIHRFEHTLKLFDQVRLDHFRGFIGYWEVPSSEETAVRGEWVAAPALDFFAALLKRFPLMPVIAEDLGIITAEVRQVMHQLGFPGMKVLQFAFYGDVASNPYAPHNHERNCVVYTGTHDNNTTKGWFKNELAEADKRRIFEYMGRTCDDEQIHWELIRSAMVSVADTCIIPLQDFLGLESNARMNLPSVSHGNWEWRVHPEEFMTGLSRRIAGLTRLYGRA